MAVDCVSQFEDQPVIPDGVFEYTDALHDDACPIVIDNGKHVTRYRPICTIDRSHCAFDGSADSP